MILLKLFLIVTFAITAAVISAIGEHRKYIRNSDD